MKESALWSKEYICICMSSFFLFTTFYAQMTVLTLLVINEFGESGKEAGLMQAYFSWVQ